MYDAYVFINRKTTTNLFAASCL